jgi:tRNA(Phe) wybutosine-synthesizing methylase Tyw3
VVDVGEYHTKILSLSSSRIVVELRGGTATVRISPKWDIVDRHEYLIVGTIWEVLDELKKLVEDLLKAVKALEELASRC